MKIGIYDPYLDDLGGGEKYMMAIAACLTKDHDVVVFWDNEKDLKDLKERFLLDLSGIKIGKNIFSPNVGILQRLKATSEFDVIFVLSDGSIPLVSSKKLFIHLQQPMSHIKALPLKTKLKLFRVTSLFCNSKFTKSYIDKTFRIESKVVYPPVEFYPKIVKKENIILNVGRLRVRDVTVDGAPIGDFKKQSVMVETFKEMVKDGLKDWKFVLAISVKEEDKEAFEKIQKLAEGVPIEFVVNKNNKLLWDVYNKAKIYWHATGFGEDIFNHPEYTEHFGISTVEAMGAGAVPVVINAGGQPEIVTDGENGFLWDTLGELKKKTNMLIEDPKLLTKLGKSAAARSKNFGGNRFCEDIYELLEI